MKVKILYTALISLIAGGAMAQDCTFFFPQTEGTVWVRKGYDAKGNLQSVMSYQVDEVETLPSGQEVEADYVYREQRRYQGILPEWRIFPRLERDALLSGSGIGNEYECGYHGELYKLPKSVCG